MNNQKGMSLVSVLIAIGLTGVLAMILMNLMQQQSKQQQRALLDGELNEINAQFLRMINQRDSCNSTFMGLKKGDSLQEFRFSFNANQDPFAEVGKTFRSTKIILREMKILTDAEMTARNISMLKDKQGFTNIVLQVTLERPSGTLGGQFSRRFFDVPVAMGKGDIIRMADPTAIESRCRTMTNSRGCIANFETGICPTNAEDAIDFTGLHYFGYCVDPNPTNANDDIVLRCTTSI